MATTTSTETSTTLPTIKLGAQSADENSHGPSYPNDAWSHTIVNYYKDADHKAVDALSTELSEHEIRVQRRSDESPNIVKTPVRIRNIQGCEHEYSIETHGFTIGRLESQMQDWKDDTELRRTYHPEVTELLRRETGAKDVFQYEWHVRSTTLEDGLSQDSTGAVDIKGPVRRVHIDETPASAIKEFNYYVADKPGNEHIRGRLFGVYNVWKPLKTVRKDPLCLCDPRTVVDEELHVTGVFVPNVGEIQNLSVRPPKESREHDFVYVREQQPEQALVFRIYDGRIDGVEERKRSHGVAHTSFVDPGTEHEAPRESVEVRSFCVF